MSKKYDAYWAAKCKEAGSYNLVTNATANVTKPKSKTRNQSKQRIADVKEVCGMMVSICTAIRTIHTTFR